MYDCSILYFSFVDYFHNSEILDMFDMLTQRFNDLYFHTSSDIFLFDIKIINNKRNISLHL